MSEIRDYVIGTIVILGYASLAATMWYSNRMARYIRDNFNKDRSEGGLEESVQLAESGENDK